MRNKVLVVFSVISIFLFGSILILSKVQEAGIYTYKVIGALYELLWIPTLLSIAILPLFWGYSIWKKQVSTLSGVSFIIVFLFLLSSLFFIS